MSLYHVIDNCTNRPTVTFTDSYLHLYGRERILQAFPGCVILHYFNGELIGRL